MRAFTVVIVLLLAASQAVADKILHEQRSLYSNILVRQSGNHICLLFKVKTDQRNQSCINTRSPRRMVFSYTRMSMAVLLFNPQPSSVLTIGLGGGTLPTAFAELFPGIEQDAVEIDPAVVDIAKGYFGFRSGPSLRVHTQDARVWVKRAALRKDRFDVIVLDAFNGEYIPEHLMTADFFQELKSLLTPQGVLVSNTFGVSELYDSESATYAHVFGDFINFRVPDSANRIILVPMSHTDNDTLHERAKALKSTLDPYGIPITRYASTLARLRERDPDWDTNARVFTDQYSPANVLRAR